MKAGVCQLAIKRAAEDYLETMLMLREEKGFVRSIDVAEQLGVTKPSVSYATKRLRESGHIIMDKDGRITLTDSGLAIASEMLKRHQALTRFLISIGVGETTAQLDACKLEHDLSQESFNAIYAYARKMTEGE